MGKKLYTHPDEAILLNIRFIRGQKILLDSDLAKLYGVPTKVLNQAVQRNKERFPEDFMFQLTEEEVGINIIEHIPGNTSTEAEFLRSQFVTSKVDGCEAEFKEYKKVKTRNGRGGDRYLPYGFTEHGVAMLSSVLRSPMATNINIQIIRIFVKMRAILASHTELQQRIEAIEQSLGTTNHAVQELYDLFIQLVKQDSDDMERKIGYKID